MSPVVLRCTKYRHAVMGLVVGGQIANHADRWMRRDELALFGYDTVSSAQSKALSQLLAAGLIRISKATPRTGVAKGVHMVFPTPAGSRWYETGPRVKRGCTNGNSRGNSESRRRRRQWLLDEYGDGTTARCWLSGPACQGSVTLDTISVERIIPGHFGGTYRRENIRPACMPCQSRQGGQMGIERARQKASNRRDRAAQYT